MGNFRGSLFLVFTTLGYFTSATSNSTGFEPIFVPEPRGRGTIGILWSCLVTFGLCVWTAIHSDIFDCPSRGKRLLHKLQWMSVAILMPEMIVAYAIVQWNEARKLHKWWCKKYVGAEGKEDRLGMEGAFFVVMGGFVVGEEGGSEEGKVNRGDHSSFRLALTPKGFIHYMEEGIISGDKINRRAIMDKGKADTLAKFLVCLQALWMLIQCAARKIHGLPITLLELHVLIQVVFVLAMYVLWWYKPLDVNEPIVAIERDQMLPSEESGLTREPLEDGLYGELLVTISLSSIGLPVTALMALLTGGSHAAAWNYHFPTPIEGLLWRISAVILAAPPLFQYLAFFFVNKLSLVSFLRILLGGFFFFLYIVYGFGIIFITVESFISMRKLPIGSYQTVAWMDFWPHV